MSIKAYLKLLIKLIYLQKGSCYVAQAGLEFKILLPQPPDCWDYRHVLPLLTRIILEDPIEECIFQILIKPELGEIYQYYAYNMVVFDNIEMIYSYFEIGLTQRLK
jgi:hypothetical protein